MQTRVPPCIPQAPARTSPHMHLITSVAKECKNVGRDPYDYIENNVHCVSMIYSYIAWACCGQLQNDICLQTNLKVQISPCEKNISQATLSSLVKDS